MRFFESAALIGISMGYEDSRTRSVITPGDWVRVDADVQVCKPDEGGTPDRVDAGISA